MLLRDCTSTLPPAVVAVRTKKRSLFLCTWRCQAPNGPSVLIVELVAVGGIHVSVHSRPECRLLFWSRRSICTELCYCMKCQGIRQGTYKAELSVAHPCIGAASCLISSFFVRHGHARDVDNRCHHVKRVSSIAGQWALTDWSVTSGTGLTMMPKCRCRTKQYKLTEN